MKKSLMLLPLAAAMGLAALPAGAYEPPPAPQAQAPQQGPAWLGVAVGPVPQAVQAQLPETIAPNQGLMVMRVVPGSPADKAGIQPNDVLIAFNGEKLFSPQDLVQRVRAAQGGDKVTVEVIRHGQPKKIEVTLESRRPPARMNRPTPWRMAPRPGLNPPGAAPQSRTQMWESFQSMSVVKGPDGKYTAVVEYLDPQGNKKRFEYQGTREEIQAQVKKERTMPEELRQQLLDALSDRTPAFPQNFPDFPDFPDIRQLEREFFQPPPWFGRGGPANPWNAQGPWN